MKHLAWIGALVLAACASPNAAPVRTKAMESARVHTELAAQYYQRAQLSVALDELRQALGFEPDYAPAYDVRGLVHMALQEDREAEADFQHSLQLDSASSEAHNNYGWFLCQRGRERESVAQFLAALKNPLYSTPEKAYLNAGICSRKAGEPKDADAYLQKALLLRPDVPEAMLALAAVKYDLGDYPAAESYFTRYVRSNAPMTAENLLLGVHIEHGMGDRKAEDSYALQLGKRFPRSREFQSLQQEK